MSSLLMSLISSVPREKKSVSKASRLTFDSVLFVYCAVINVDLYVHQHMSDMLPSDGRKAVLAKVSFSTNWCYKLKCSECLKSDVGLLCQFAQ
jgi:hypothetical protein